MANLINALKEIDLLKIKMVMITVMMMIVFGDGLFYYI